MKQKPWYQYRCEETGNTPPAKSTFTCSAWHASYNKGIPQRLRYFMFRKLVLYGLLWQYEIDPADWVIHAGSVT